FAKTKVIFGDVPADDRHLIANETFQGVAISLAQWIEWARANHVIPESRFRFLLRTSSHRYIYATDIGKSVQQHAQGDFAHKARTAYQQNSAAVEDFSWRKRFTHSAKTSVRISEARAWFWRRNVLTRQRRRRCLRDWQCRERCHHWQSR